MANCPKCKQTMGFLGYCKACEEEQEATENDRMESARQSGDLTVLSRKRLKN